MTLSAQEKKILSDYRMKKAEEMLADARFNLEHGRYATSVNRSYYAMLNAARALLILKGIDPATHSGCKTMLSMHFVREGLLENSFVEDFKVLLSRRTDIDYGDFEVVDEEKARDSLKKAERFIQRIENLRSELTI